jgi:hypothetical protein
MAEIQFVEKTVNHRTTLSRGSEVFGERAAVGTMGKSLELRK